MTVASGGNEGENRLLEMRGCEVIICKEMQRSVYCCHLSGAACIGNAVGGTISWLAPGNPGLVGLGT